jgi:hypothetical protein
MHADWKVSDGECAFREGIFPKGGSAGMKSDVKTHSPT